MVMFQPCNGCGNKLPIELLRYSYESLYLKYCIVCLVDRNKTKKKNWGGEDNV